MGRASRVVGGGSWVVVGVSPLTIIRPRTGVNRGAAISPFTMVRGSIIVNSGYHVCSRTAVLSNTQVNGGYRMFPKTIVTNVPRSLGFGKRVAATRVKGGAVLHRYIAIGHKATSGNGAIINGGYLVVTCSRVTRSYLLGSGVVVNGTSRVTKRMRVSSFTVIDNNDLIRRFSHVSGRIVVRNNSQVNGSVPPCALVKHSPVICYNVGVMKLHHHKFAGDRMFLVRSVCHALCAHNLGGARTLGTVRARCRPDRRQSLVLGFVGSSRHNVIENSVSRWWYTGLGVYRYTGREVGFVKCVNALFCYRVIFFAAFRPAGGWWQL